MPDLSRTLTNFAPRLNTTNDHTDDTDWTATELANSVEGAESTWVLRVPDGDIPDMRHAHRKFAQSHNVVRVTVGSNTLFRGRVMANDFERGDSVTYRNQRWTINLGDYNTDLSGINVFNWVRPAETDAARVQALVAGFLSGHPRDSTNINGSNYVVLSSNTIQLEAKTYVGVTPGEVLAEIAEEADKDAFIDVDGNLHYTGHDYAGFDSILRISDDIADLNTVTCFPIDASGSQEGTDHLTQIRSYYGPQNDDGSQRSVVVDRDLTEGRTDFWAEAFFDDDSRNATQAERRALARLIPLSQDLESYTVTIGKPGIIQAGQATPMTGDDIWKIKAGQRIAFKSKAVRGGYRVNGTNRGDEFTTMQVCSVRWTMPTPDAYYATLELQKPKRLGARGKGRGQPKSTTPRPAPEFTPNPGDSVVKFYRGDTTVDVGGDVLHWDGSIQTDSAGNGAEGSDSWVFKSAAPDKYQMTWAASEGAVYRVAGYVGCDSDGFLTLNFFSSPAGTDGGSIDPTSVLASHTLTPAQPGHEHAPEWTGFSAGPFTAPAGTNSAALGRTVGISFDETHIYLVGDPAENDDNAVDYGATCPHNSPFFLPSDYAMCLHDELQGQINDLQDGLGDFTGDHGELDGLADDDHPQYVRTTLGGKDVVSTVTAAGSTETLDLATANFHDVTLTADCTLTLTGATNGVACYMTILLRQGSGAPWDVTWPGSVEWVGGSAPTLETAEDAWNLVVLVTRDGGTTWFADGGGGTGGGGSSVDVSDGTTTVSPASEIVFTGADFDVTDGGGGEADVAIAAPSSITPTQLSANTDNWNPTGLSSTDIIRASTDASRNLTGITAPSVARSIVLENIGTNNLVLKHNVTSTAANRFFLPNDTDLTMPKDSAVLLVYDTTSSRWRTVGGVGTAGSVDAADVTFTPTDPMVSTNVQDAIDEVLTLIVLPLTATVNGAPELVWDENDGLIGVEVY